MDGEGQSAVRGQRHLQQPDPGVDAVRWGVGDGLQEIPQLVLRLGGPGLGRKGGPLRSRGTEWTPPHLRPQPAVPTAQPLPRQHIRHQPNGRTPGRCCTRRSINSGTWWVRRYSCWAASMVRGGNPGAGGARCCWVDQFVGGKIWKNNLDPETQSEYNKKKDPDPDALFPVWVQPGSILPVCCLTAAMPQQLTQPFQTTESRALAMYRVTGKTSPPGSLMLNRTIEFTTGGLTVNFGNTSTGWQNGVNEVG